MAQSIAVRDRAPLRVKICGLTRRGDVRAAESAGAFFGGVILAPGSPRTLEPACAAEIFRGSSLERCGVFIDESLARIDELVGALDLRVVQLHGDESPETAAAIRDATGVTVWKAVRPRSAAEFLLALEAFNGAVDGLLLDGWSAAARGGTGARFPWREVAEHRDRVGGNLQLIAAGGLNSDNVGEVAALLAPDIVDVSSGVESAPGMKDDGMIRAFVEAVMPA